LSDASGTVKRSGWEVVAPHDKNGAGRLSNQSFGDRTKHRAPEGLGETSASSTDHNQIGFCLGSVGDNRSRRLASARRLFDGDVAAVHASEHRLESSYLELVNCFFQLFIGLCFVKQSFFDRNSQTAFIANVQDAELRPELVCQPA